MCVVSMVMDHYHDKWWRLFPPPQPWVAPAMPPAAPLQPAPAISPAEVDEFRRLLERAREYDRLHNQPDCELDEKREKLRKLARDLGVEIAFV